MDSRGIEWLRHIPCSCDVPALVPKHLSHIIPSSLPVFPVSLYFHNIQIKAKRPPKRTISGL